MKKDIKQSLDGIYDFMSRAFHGNWQYRWIGTPHLQKNLKVKRNESIAGHQWACVGFWFHLNQLCPALSALVDKAEIYERLWSHDLGETFVGDVSQARQISGEGKDKHILERKEIEKMGKNLPEKTLKQLLVWFDEAEDDFSNMKKIEPLITKFIDTMSGNHFAMVFGNDLSKHKILIQKIVNRGFVSVVVSVVQQLLKVLKKQGHKKAHEEVRQLSLYHLRMINKKGIEISLDFFK